MGSAIRTPAAALSRACCPTVRTILVISLATHILGQTGCYEQTRYAMQDTPDVVQHYGPFLPQDKTVLAAKILKPGLRGRIGKEKGAVSSKSNAQMRISLPNLGADLFSTA